MTIKTTGLCSKLTFGKYKGKRVKHIASFDPEYLKWAEENIDKFVLSNRARKLVNYELSYKKINDETVRI